MIMNDYIYLSGKVYIKSVNSKFNPNSQRKKKLIELETRIWAVRVNFYLKFSFVFDFIIHIRDISPNFHDPNFS